MTTVVPTSDGRWMITYEYWGGGDNVRYKISDNPLNFHSVGGATGTAITSLTIEASTASGSQDWQFVQVAGVAGTHTVVGPASGRCLDVPNHSTSVSTQVDIWDCNSGNNQRWTLNADGTIRGVESGLCLDARANGTTDGTAVQTFTCNGGTNQRWTAAVDGTLRGVQSGLCLDAPNHATANGTLLQLYTCNGGSNQKWNIS